MSSLTRFVRVLMAAGLLLWGGAVFAGTEKQSGHQPAKPAAKSDAKPEPKGAPAHAAAAAAGSHEPEQVDAGHAKPAAKPGTKPAAGGHDAAAPAAGATETDAAHTPSASAPKPGPRRKPTARDAEAEAREVVRRIESIMADGGKPLPVKGASATAHPAPAAAGAANRPAGRTPRPKPARLLTWDVGLSPGNVTLVWDVDLKPFGAAPGRTGVRLEWPVDEAKAPRR